MRVSPTQNPAKADAANGTSGYRHRPASTQGDVQVRTGPSPCWLERRLFPGSGAWSSVLALYADLPFMYLFELAADDLCGPVTSLRATSAVAADN
jgi:hypothetical protein